MLAAWSSEPEWNLTDAEAEALARGMVEVERHYSIPIRKEHMAIGALSMTVIKVYYGKYRAIQDRKKRQKSMNAGPPPAPNPPPFDLGTNHGVANVTPGPVDWFNVAT
jgi:hypothetical protein